MTRLSAYNIAMAAVSMQMKRIKDISGHWHISAISSIWIPTSQLSATIFWIQAGGLIRKTDWATAAEAIISS